MPWSSWSSRRRKVDLSGLLQAAQSRRVDKGAEPQRQLVFEFERSDHPIPPSWQP